MLPLHRRSHQGKYEQIYGQIFGPASRLRSLLSLGAYIYTTPTAMNTARACSSGQRVLSWLVIPHLLVAPPLILTRRNRARPRRRCTTKSSNQTARRQSHHIVHKPKRTWGSLYRHGGAGNVVRHSVPIAVIVAHGFLVAYRPISHNHGLPWPRS